MSCKKYGPKLWACMTLLGACSNTPPTEPPQAPDTPVPEAHSTRVRVDNTLIEQGRVHITTAQLRAPRDKFTLPGEALADEAGAAYATTLVGGRVASLEVTDGQTIAAGQVLAWIDAPEAVRARAEWLRAQGRQIQTSRVRKREEELAIEHATSQNALDEARATDAAAQADLRAAQTLLHHYGTDARGRVAVRAPIAGVLAQRLTTLGSPVTPDKPLFHLVAPTRVYVAARLPESADISIQTGQQVRLFPRDLAAQEPCAGRVVNVLPVVDAQRARTVRVAPDACPALFAGRYVDVEFDTTTPLTAAVVVPKSAVVELKGIQVVFTEVATAPGEFEATPVRTGAATQADVAIEAGLSAGARVVDKGVVLVKGELLRAELGS
jgi:cobalt-zinc-cadmium efflux system membrane fusion protein